MVHTEFYNQWKYPSKLKEEVFFCSFPYLGRDYSSWARAKLKQSSPSEVKPTLTGSNWVMGSLFASQKKMQPSLEEYNFILGLYKFLSIISSIKSKSYKKQKKKKPHKQTNRK